MDEKDVYFEVTKEKKINRIHQLNIKIFIDDLESILELIRDDVQKILYNPNNIKPKLEGINVLKNWRELPDLIYKKWMNINLNSLKITLKKAGYFIEGTKPINEGKNSFSYLIKTQKKNFS